MIHTSRCISALLIRAEYLVSIASRHPDHAETAKEAAQRSIATLRHATQVTVPDAVWAIHEALSGPLSSVELERMSGDLFGLRYDVEAQADCRALYATEKEQAARALQTNINALNISVVEPLIQKGREVEQALTAKRIAAYDDLARKVEDGGSLEDVEAIAVEISALHSQIMRTNMQTKVIQEAVQ